MTNFIILLSLFTLSETRVYVGTWKTSAKLKLSGNLRCDVTYLGNNEWKGTFTGNWRRVNFKYDVVWSGETNNLRGIAKIGNQDYQWAGKINRRWFVGRFKSQRYIGEFQLERKR